MLFSSDRINYLPVNGSHLEDLVALDADPEVMRFINGGLPTAAAHYRDNVLPRWLALQHRAPHLGFFILQHSDDGRILGWVHNRPFVNAEGDESGELEVGYRLFRREWGQGFATEAADWVVRLNQHQDERGDLVAIAMPDNLASIAVMRHIGMSWTARYQHHTGVEVVKFSRSLAIAPNQAK
jgi:RimJ/RimL family protein N-acetyltransferase